MVKHVVMFDVHETEGRTALENVNIIKEKLEGLMGKIPSLRSMEVGINGLKSDTSQDYVILATFDDFKGLEEYDVHPEHKKTGEFIRSCSSNRHAVDFEY